MSLRINQFITRPSLRGFIFKDVLQGRAHGPKATQIKLVSKVPSQLPDLELHISLAALNINTIKTPPLFDPTRSKIPPPLPLPQSIELPQIQRKVTYEDQVPNKTIEEPNQPGVQEKQAARLIVIRRKKMKKHKLRKLRKKMKFERLKIIQKRELKKEKLFQAVLIEKIKSAVAFDPAKYAAEKIAKAKEVELPKHWHGVRYPEFIIKQLIEEKEMKDKEKAADEKRRASMSPYVKDYLKNLPK